MLDRAGLAAVDLSDPQTLNRYACVRNSPLHMIDPSGLDGCDENGDCGGGGGTGCPDSVCGPPINQGGINGPGPGQNTSGSGFVAPPPIGLPGQQLPGATPSTFPTGPGVDWTSVLFGPPDPALLIFNFCVNKSGVTVGCTASDAYADCGSGEGSTACAQSIALGTFVGPPLPPCFYGCASPVANSATPWYKTCKAGAIGNGLLRAGIDAIGLFPEGGLIARAVGNFAGWRGKVASQQGRKIIQSVKMGTGIGSTGAGSNDTSPAGNISTGLGVAGIVSTLAGATPVVGQVLSGVSIIVDAVGAGMEFAKCN